MRYNSPKRVKTAETLIWCARILCRRFNPCPADYFHVLHSSLLACSIKAVSIYFQSEWKTVWILIRWSWSWCTVLFLKKKRYIRVQQDKGKIDKLGASIVFFSNLQHKSAKKQSVCSIFQPVITLSDSIIQLSTVWLEAMWDQHGGSQCFCKTRIFGGHWWPLVWKFGGHWQI